MKLIKLFDVKREPIGKHKDSYCIVFYKNKASRYTCMNEQLFDKGTHHVFVGNIPNDDKLHMFSSFPVNKLDCLKIHAAEQWYEAIKERALLEKELEINYKPIKIKSL